LHRLSALRPVPPPVSHLAALLCLDRASVLPPSFDFSVVSALGFQPASHRPRNPSKRLSLGTLVRRDSCSRPHPQQSKGLCLALRRL
jgi:hypothetical protein